MPWTLDDATWMNRAIGLAREGAVSPGMNPIGCVIVRNGEVPKSVNTRLSSVR